MDESPPSILIPLLLAAIAVVVIGILNKEIAGYLEQFLGTVAMGRTAA